MEHIEVADAAVPATCLTTGLTAGSHCGRCNVPIVAQAIIDALNHDDTGEWKHNTDGHYKICAREDCGEVILESGHSMDTDATCLLPSSVCECGYQMEALGHDMVTDAAVEPTCTKTGLTAGEHCSRCDDMTTAQTIIDALDHDMVTDAAVAPTCTKTGLTAGEHCSRCDDMTTAQTVIEALGHDMITDAAIEPTCTKPGFTAGAHCSRCDEATTPQTIIDKLRHDESGDWVKDANGHYKICARADCDVAILKGTHGITTDATCLLPSSACVCGYQIDALGHDMITDAAVAPTCTQKGLTAGAHCSRCDEATTAQTVIDALGHDESGDWVKDANGHYKICARADCDDVLLKGKHGIATDATCLLPSSACECGYQIAALGHDMITDAAVEPTCTKKGLTEGAHCARCDGATTAQTVIDALGHDMIIDAAVEPTCTKTGLTEGSHCSRCDEATTEQTIIDALGHGVRTNAAVPATCLDTGLTEGKYCYRCGKVTAAQTVIDALGHDEATDAAVPATCLATGLTAGSHCSRCGETLVRQQVIPALGHDIQDGVCKVCGWTAAGSALTGDLPFRVLDEQEKTMTYTLSLETAEDETILLVAVEPEPDGSYASRYLLMNADVLGALYQHGIDALHITLGDAVLSISLAAADQGGITSALDAMDGDKNEAILMFAFIVTPGDAGAVYDCVITLVCGEEISDVTALFPEIMLP